MIHFAQPKHLMGMEFDDDAHERPTLPAPLAFEAPAVEFFAMRAVAQGTVAAYTTEDTTEEELSEWWAKQRRRAHTSWVAAVMALCVALLVLGALR